MTAVKKRDVIYGRPQKASILYNIKFHSDIERPKKRKSDNIFIFLLQSNEYR